MRILLLTETLYPGGAEVFVVRLANALAAAGQDVMIAVTNGELVHAALTDRIAPAVSVERLRLPAKRWLSRADRLLRMLRIDLPLLHKLQLRWLGRVVERWRPEVVHSHLVKADWLASESKARTGGFRHVITSHGEQLAYAAGIADPQMLHFDRRYGDILARADGIVAISDEQERHVRDCFPLAAPALTRIYNGYAPPSDTAAMPSRAQLGLPEGKLLFGMVSRGMPEKGWGEAIAAFQRIGRDDCALVLVGQGPFFDALGTPPPGVILAGFSADPIAWMRHFDVGLLPSWYVGESLPTVIVEYLACGLPVIASDIGEIPAMLQAGNDDAGFVVPHRDRAQLVKTLAEAMSRLASDPGLRREKAVLAHEAFARFDMAESVERYLALYAGAPR